jgi:hypothetical protein
MAKLSFSLKLLSPMAQHTEEAATHAPTLEQQFDKTLWKKGLDLHEDEIFRSNGDHIDLAKVPPGFWLVKDRGIYMMSNGRPRQLLDAGATKSYVVYAKGYQPGVDEDWFDRACDAVGGDDFVQFIPLEWFAAAKSAGKRVLTIRVSDDFVEYCS